MIGTIMVDEVYGVEENVEKVSPLTINSLEIYEDADYTRYRVTGDAPASTEITFKNNSPTTEITFRGGASGLGGGSKPTC